jgi:hypothetical protein
MLAFVALVAIGISVLVHLIVAVAVMNDSVVIQRRGVRLMFFGTPGWTFLSLMTGLFGLLAYWLMHHSSFRRAVPETNVKEQNYAEHAA